MDSACDLRHRHEKQYKQPLPSLAWANLVTAQWQSVFPTPQAGGRAGLARESSDSAVLLRAEEYWAPEGGRLGVRGTGKRETQCCQIRVDRSEMLSPQDLGVKLSSTSFLCADTVTEKETQLSRERKQEKNSHPCPFPSPGY